MAYTWEEVMLGIDVRHEMSEKEKQRQAIADKRTKEEESMAGWSLGLSLLGAISPLGPLGYTLGKQIGKIGADLWGPGSDWEEDVAALDEGKFHTGEAKQYKKGKQKEIAAQDKGQYIDFATDLASLYLMAGGLKEGPMDWTTFGGGGDQWSVLGRGTAGAPGYQLPVSEVAGGTSFINVPPIAPSEDFIPGLRHLYETGGFKGVKEKVGSNLPTQSLFDLLGKEIS
jgi:hypothetical protein